MQSSGKTLINPPGTEQIYRHFQFSQAVRAGNRVWVSGQVGIDENGKAAEGIEAQARAAFVNLQHVLAEAGAGMQDVVELVTYHTAMKEIGRFLKVKAEFIPSDFPAWTAVGVTELVMPELLCEIRATAVIGSGGSRPEGT
ncbi:enamine deaminase RidA (YjgF/YER057c/UK114 family) [Desulfosalsimonas propionicica]|uniref:Enamine deaminase RidA (YjgF/YER057c/UK114 family) n=1 Tax=Desulfosalsimonas propionicica TaxID=332175 RepID=A0A7W0HLD5_9BACT|nr:RidA family protein [Desulfosalsimonas propionicica]MBA2882183.1 enamine deaminase RidA (YjgF/YER057c/UK114 family) [Desulfosalsimonas propionicica]